MAEEKPSADVPPSDPAESVTNNMAKLNVAEGGEAKEPAKDITEYEVVVSEEHRSALLSVDNFVDLSIPEGLVRGAQEGLGFNQPSQIQAKLLPLALKDPPQNVIAQSINGSGKTVAFLLAAAARVDPSVPGTQVICVSHTRELARQTFDVCKRLVQFTGISVGLTVKERGLPTDVSEHIVVGTHGTIKLLLNKKVLGARNVRMIVLDEADELMNDTRKKNDPVVIKKSVVKARGRQPVQVILISATFPDELESFVKSFAPGAARISVESPTKLVLDTVRQLAVMLPQDDEAAKIKVMATLINGLAKGQIMVFANTRRKVQEITERLRAEGVAVSMISGQIDDSERDFVIDEFKAGRTKAMVTSDLLARGTDVLAVQLVFNYDVPFTRVQQQGELVVKANKELYLNRVGRTGRFGKLGVAVTLINSGQAYQLMSEVQDHFGRKVESENMADVTPETLDERTLAVIERVEDWMEQKVHHDVPKGAADAK